MKILIKEVRKNKGITLRELAFKSGIPKSTLSNFENDKSSPDMDNLEAIARALNCRIADLFDENIESI